jgi:hypothetical protein
VSAARLAARCLALLGPLPGPVAVVAPRAAAFAAALAAHVPLAGPERTPAGAVVAFLDLPARPHERQQTLHALRSRLENDAPLVLVDHSQPRARWRRPLAALALGRAGLRPSRARYPAARELAALGFRVECLRLACGERVQLVLARR